MQLEIQVRLDRVFSLHHLLGRFGPGKVSTESAICNDRSRDLLLLKGVLAWPELILRVVEGPYRIKGFLVFLLSDACRRVMLALSFGGETCIESMGNSTTLSTPYGPLAESYVSLLSRRWSEKAKTPYPALLQEQAEMRELEQYVLGQAKQHRLCEYCLPNTSQ